MRILITGSAGQLGTALQNTLADHELFLADLPAVDVTSRASVFEAFAAAQPALALHCAAYTDVDGCARDPQLAYRVNGLGTQNVALACQHHNATLVHISSNEVLGGERPGGYEEWMPLNPPNPYARSKAAAEVYVRNLLQRFYIVRLSWLFAPNGRNFIHKILQRAAAHGEVRVVTDEIASPTYAKDLAVALRQLIATRQYGIYHLVNEGACSRWAFANEILRLAGMDHVRNVPILSCEFERPSTPPPYGALRNIAAAALGIRLRPWQAALAEYVREYVNPAADT